MPPLKLKIEFVYQTVRLLFIGKKEQQRHQNGCDTVLSVCLSTKVKVKVKGKVVRVLLLSSTPLRRMGKGRYSSTHSTTRQKMEVNGQLHAPVALPTGKEPLVPIG
jgi:hypothetical protein